MVTNMSMKAVLASEEGLSRLFDLDMQLVADSALMIIAVFFLFLIASHFLFNPVRKLLNERKENIRNNIDSAENEKKDAEELKTKYEDLMKNVHKETEAILADARKRALDNEARILDEARQEASNIIVKARKEAELEKAKMSDEMKREMVAVASMMAAKVVSVNIDTNVQYELIDETLKEIGDRTWQS